MFEVQTQQREVAEKIGSEQTRTGIQLVYCKWMKWMRVRVEESA